jgi:hypothetical protein
MLLYTLLMARRREGNEPFRHEVHVLRTFTYRFAAMKQILSAFNFSHSFALLT